ncbi:3-dehydroquinate synthase [Luminiphilus sp. nBUS_07]|uniref:3-dehydroquinate synthase n=1 Tax=Luminiphilus sp. nBUS_07 TaxID=3395314 RepID=UPI003EBFB41C
MSKPIYSLQVDLHASAIDRSYPIIIGHGCLGDGDRFSELLGDAPVVLVSNDTVAPLYMARVRAALGKMRRVTEVILPDGEDQKHLMSAETIWQQALRDHHERRSIFIALGGGVIGDLTGYGAACFLRGVEFIQLPTTLLAQVDSSVGGKTAVNHPLGKNMIGAFHQPKAVLIDLDSLQTLPDREFAAGIAETIKYGCIWDPAFFNWLLQQSDALRSRSNEVLAEAIQRSCAIKAEVVSQDEREGGLRAILNFGHTFAHAIEQTMGYGAWLHGEAVACGMVMAAKISAARDQISGETVAQLAQFLTSFGLPVEPPKEMSPEGFLAVMAGDKKVDRGKIRYILLQRLGEACLVDDVTIEEIAQAME